MRLAVHSSDRVRIYRYAQRNRFATGIARFVGQRTILLLPWIAATVAIFYYFGSEARSGARMFGTGLPAAFPPAIMCVWHFLSRACLSGDGVPGWQWYQAAYIVANLARFLALAEQFC